ncbi:hypothetical protein [Terrimonas alba]|uniref:hypothetical protein n=1 Tax=Terrimonas alba TaxID=3349636 RepID=UPI0035F423AD
MIVNTTSEKTAPHIASNSKTQGLYPSIPKTATAYNSSGSSRALADPIVIGA